MARVGLAAALLAAMSSCGDSTGRVDYRVGLEVAPVDSGAPAAPVYLWYPSTDDARPPLQYRQLLALVPERRWDEWFFDEPVRFGAPRDSLAALLDRVTETSLGLRPVDERLPLAVFLPGNGHPGFVNLRLSEVLARRGFVVGATSFPATSGEDATRLQAADVMRIVSRAERLGLFEGQTIVLIGHSAGATAAQLASFADPRVKAVVSLDGSDVSRSGAAYLREHSPLASSGATAPSLHLLSRWWRAMDSVSASFDGLTLERSAPGSFAIDLMHLEHPDFVSMDLDRSRYVDYAKAGIAHDADQAAVEYAETLQLIGDFLDFTLEGDARAGERLRESGSASRR